MVQTIDSEKLATSLNNSWEKYRTDELKLKVLIQVNTSNEEGNFISYKMYNYNCI